MADGTIEIITGRERRRRWGIAEKLKIVAESHEPGARIGDVAARYDVCPSLLHGWRRLAREGRLDSSGPSGFVPVRLASLNETSVAAAGPQWASDPKPPAIEVFLASGARVLIRGDARSSAVHAVISALRG